MFDAKRFRPEVRLGIKKRRTTDSGFHSSESAKRVNEYENRCIGLKTRVLK
jgi:hypothetical protein